MEFLSKDIRVSDLIELGFNKVESIIDDDGTDLMKIDQYEKGCLRILDSYELIDANEWGNRVVIFEIIGDKVEDNDLDSYLKLSKFNL